LVLVPTPGKFPVKGREGGYQVRPVFVFAEVMIVDKRGVATYSVRPLDLPGESSFAEKKGQEIAEAAKIAPLSSTLRILA
jgi:hypothetical protein